MTPPRRGSSDNFEFLSEDKGQGNALLAHSASALPALCHPHCPLGWRCLKAWAEVNSSALRLFRR